MISILAQRLICPGQLLYEMGPLVFNLKEDRVGELAVLLQKQAGHVVTPQGASCAWIVCRQVALNWNT